MSRPYNALRSLLRVLAGSRATRAGESCGGTPSGAVSTARLSRGPAGVRRTPLRIPAAWATIIAAVLLALLAACAPSSTVPPSPTAGTPGPLSNGSSDWLRFGFDPARSGVNPNETAITRDTVGKLHRLWQMRLPDVADSSPAFVHGVKLSDGQTRDMLFVTTRDGRLIALDAGGGGTIWARQPSGARYTTSSPVVDPNRQYVYAYGLDGSLHRYALATGEETTGNGWPVLISKMTQTEKESSSLNIANGRVYVPTAGYPGDAPPYQGHVVVADAASGTSTVFNTLCANLTHVLAQGECAQNQSGIWARAGALVDPETGNIFVVTGNGDYNASSGGHDFGDSVIELSGDATRILDSYTPANYQELDDSDRDLGSTNPALLPRLAASKTPLLAVQGGKDGTLRVLNRQNLSGQGGLGHVGGEVQAIPSAACNVFTQPVVWTDPASARVWLFVAGTCATVGYQVVTDSSGVTTLQQAWKLDTTGTTPVLAGGILFLETTQQAIVALDPTTGKTLWSSANASAGGTIGSIHWESLIVVNGRLYATDENATVSAFGL
ncbi:MAG TPA: PQQ-binding-like beta-propeller repeat protein [Ktedonobacterales bacterium]